MKIRQGFEVSQDPSGMYIARAVGDLQQQFPQAIQMGLSGAYLWDLLTRRDCTRTELIYELENFFELDVDTDSIARDVDMFTGFLREQGILEPEV